MKFCKKKLVRSVRENCNIIFILSVCFSIFRIRQMNCIIITNKEDKHAIEVCKNSIDVERRCCYRCFYVKLWMPLMMSGDIKLIIIIDDNLIFFLIQFYGITERKMRKIDGKLTTESTEWNAFNQNLLDFCQCSLNWIKITQNINIFTPILLIFKICFHLFFLSFIHAKFIAKFSDCFIYGLALENCVRLNDCSEPTN